MILTTLKVISATTKVILATYEVIGTILKVISATTKVILTAEEVITANLKELYQPLQSCCDHFFIGQDQFACNQAQLSGGWDNF